MESFSETSHFSRLAEIKDTNKAEVFCYKGQQHGPFFSNCYRRSLIIEGDPTNEVGWTKSGGTALWQLASIVS